MIRFNPEPNVAMVVREDGRYVRYEDAQALQARIDALMLEYCPKEMTAEQLEEWAKHQAPVKK
jgi:hypothetical protein